MSYGYENHEVIHTYETSEMLFYDGCMRYTMKGSNRREPFLDLRRYLLTMLVSKVRQTANGTVKAGQEIRQGLIEGVRRGGGGLT